MNKKRVARNKCISMMPRQATGAVKDDQILAINSRETSNTFHWRSWNSRKMPSYFTKLAKSIAGDQGILAEMPPFFTRPTEFIAGNHESLAKQTLFFVGQSNYTAKNHETFVTKPHRLAECKQTYMVCEKRNRILELKPNSYRIS